MALLNILLIVHVSGQACGGSFTVGEGMISSPPGPGVPYTNNAFCEWTIGEADSQVEITVGTGLLITLYHVLARSFGHESCFIYLSLILSPVSRLHTISRETNNVKNEAGFVAKSSCKHATFISVTLNMQNGVKL